MTDFYNLMKLDATAIGNHEWDWGKDRIIKFMNNANYTYLAANI
jgi:2',3'-cyclic-nucleotide 2'-phosphodiesterase (5'-nucleotidase family)